MKENKKAFPFSEIDERGNPVNEHTGMDLLDYFAAKAMQSIILEYPTSSEDNLFDVDEETYLATSFYSYEMGQAMMDERKKRKDAKQQK